MSKFLNLAPIMDDKTVLSNPHKGWYVHYVDNGFARPFYRDSIPKGNHLEDIPGIHHLYIRFDWSDIEISEGVFDWNKIDDILNEWINYGMKFSLRLCTCCINSATESSVPKWVLDLGAKGYYKEGTNAFTGGPDKSWFPDYGDPIYMEKLENFMKEYSRKYNGHPQIEFIDIGTYGVFGEGHSPEGSKIPLEIIKWHIDIHAKYFPDTLILVNDDMLRNYNDEQSLVELANYCLEKNIGLRDDSALVTYYSKQYGFDTLCKPELFNLFAERFPIDIESTHQQFILPEVARGELTYFETLRHSHATFSGFHGDVLEWYNNHSYFHNHIANLLGYWYFVEGITIPENIYEGMNSNIILQLNNKGFAKCYYEYDLKVRINENIVATIPKANRNLLPEKPVDLHIPIKTKDLTAGEYGIEIGIFEGNQAIKLAIKEESKRDGGYYEIATIKILKW